MAEGHGNDSTAPFPSFPFSKYIAGGGFGGGEVLTQWWLLRTPSAFRSSPTNNGEAENGMPG